MLWQFFPRWGGLVFFRFQRFKLAGFVLCLLLTGTAQARALRVTGANQRFFLWFGPAASISFLGATDGMSVNLSSQAEAQPVF